MMIIRTQGHSLIELLIVVCVICTLLICCNVAFNLFEKNQMDVFVTRLYHILQLARMQAIKDNQTITVCPTDNYIECSEIWSRHYMVFNRSNHVYHFQGDIPQNMHITANLPSHVRFRSNGQAFENGTITLQLANQKRQLIIITSGRIRLV